MFASSHAKSPTSAEVVKRTLPIRGGDVGLRKSECRRLDKARIR